MTTSLKLYKTHSKTELLAMSKEITNNPLNRVSGGIYTLNPKARKKTAEIASAIAMHIEDDRERQGRPVPVCGYSGRKSNK